MEFCKRWYVYVRNRANRYVLKMKKQSNMKLRVTKKSDGKFAVQQLETTPKEQWIELNSGFDTVADAESYIINGLGVDIKEEVVAVYENNVKTVNL